MDSMEARISLVKRESERIKQYLNTLTPLDLSQPSACEGWEVQDVVAHLTMAVDNFTGNISRRLQGDASPPEGFPPAGQGDMNARMAANAQRAVAFRESLGADLLPAFSARCGSLDELLAGLGPLDWEKPCYHPLAPTSVRTFVDLRLTELVIHEWDIRSRLDASAHVSVDSLPAAMDLIPGFVVGRLFQPGTGGASAVRYRFDLTGAVPGSHDIVIEDGRA